MAVYITCLFFLVPTAPEITDIIPLSPKEVLIKWNPPTGQHEVILQYVISYSSAHQQEVPFRRTAAGHVTMATISGLDPAVQYTFNISTISKGAGPQAILLRREREGKGIVPLLPHHTPFLVEGKGTSPNIPLAHLG